MNHYRIVSPSLDGVIRHDVMMYEGINRPAEVMKIFDRPAGKNSEYYDTSGPEREILERYFHDVYGIFLKKLSCYVMASESDIEEDAKLMALLQEMIKIKKLL